MMDSSSDARQDSPSRDGCFGKLVAFASAASGRGLKDITFGWRATKTTRSSDLDGHPGP